MITPSFTAGLILLTPWLSAWAQPSVEVVRALRIGQWRTAAESLRESLEHTPDDPELLARLGLAYYQLGLYSDAEAAFRDAAGSTYYEAQGIGAHASTLRELGHFDEAAPLRQAQLLAADNDSNITTALLGATEDALAAGDPGLALSWAEQALAFRPSSPNAHAWLADAYHRAGDLESAEYHLWLSELDGYRSNRAREVRVRIALDEGAVIEALELVSDSRQGRRRNASLAVLHARVYRELGWYADAQEVFGRQFVNFGERRDYLVERGQLALAVGETTEGCAMLNRADSLYPHHPQARALIAEAGCRAPDSP